MRSARTAKPAKTLRLPLRVWAPSASRVEVIAGDLRFDLDQVEKEWWAGGLPDTGGDVDYAIILDGKDEAITLPPESVVILGG